MQYDVASFIDDDCMRDLNPRTIILVACICDQIQTLGRFYKAGMWRTDPAEIGDWLRLATSEAPVETGGKLRRPNGDLIEEAIREWRLWGRGTDILIEVLDRDTVIRIDRGRIIERAKAFATPALSRTILRAKSRHNKRVINRKRAGSIQVMRSNRAV
jgi:hypothetical protein